MRTVLSVNCGSSSVRLDAFDADRGTPVRIASERREGAPDARRFASFLRETGQAVDLVAHRVVHGGPAHAATVRLDAKVEAAIADAAGIAPLHNRAALEGLRAARQATGEGPPHFAVFDTAFFSGLPAAARTYAIDASLAKRLGVRRLGFHGLAHASMWRKLVGHRPDLASSGRAIAFQLGSGCSAAAIAGGRALDTSMGFTPLEGLVMATRCGDLDPGLARYLQVDGGLDPERLDAMLSRRSGLAGLAGESDMRKLLARSDAAARLAVDVYCHRARRYLGAFLAVLGGADAIVFGGGVGENAPEVRARILEGMQWTGLSIDPGRNASADADARIAADGSKVDCWVLAVDEATILAEEALAAFDGA